MILVNELRGKIRAKGYTQEKLAKELSISQKTLINKLSKGVFGSDEMEKKVMVDRELFHRKKGFRMLRKFEGMTTNDSIEILKEVPRDTKICTELLGENF